MSTSRGGSRPGALALLAALVLSVVPVLTLTAPADAAPAAPPVAPVAEGGSLWTASAQRPQASLDGHRRSVNPSSYQAYTLDAEAAAGLLGSAPLEGTAAARRGATTIEVPGPTGELIEFAIVESPIMEPELAAAHPEITTYAGSSVTDGYNASIRLDLTPHGFHASVRDGHSSWYVDPAYLGDDSLYLSYYGAALPAPERGLVEPELDKSAVKTAAGDAVSPRVGEGPGAVVKQRVYRLALVTDSSYAEYIAPGLNDGAHETESNAEVLAAKTTLMNRVNQIYNDDLAIKMIFVAGTDLLNLNTTTDETNAGFPASGSGSLAAGCTSALLNRNQTAVDTLIGTANYEIGHIALGISGGGIAGLGVVGRNGQKAQGCTGLPTPVGDFMAIDYVAHEMGHQFSGNHTFNGSQSSCGGGNRNAGTSVEPGSGSSVMAYAGICAQSDLQRHTDPYFSQRTQTEVSTYVNGAAADTRGGFQVVTTTNHNPTVTAPVAKSIPIRTPFTLTGSATDADGNALTYLWEQNNTAATATSLTAATKLTGALFRVFGKYADVSNTDTLLYNSPGENLATGSPSRTFPDMAQILAGSTNAETGSCPTTTATTALPDGPILECFSEFLPTATYTPTSMTFRLTARDQVATGGGTSFADVVLTVDKTKGPFLVSSPNTADSYVGGSTQTVTWTSGMDTLSANVKILMSTDSGLTFPTILAASTPNDGTQSVTIPNTATTTARIKIQAVENYFFDVSDTDFTVTAGGGGASLAVNDTIPDNVNTQYTDGVTASFSASSGVADSAALVATPTGLPAGLTLGKTAQSAGGVIPGTSTWTVQGAVTAAPGSYPVSIDVTDGVTLQIVDFTVVVAQEAATATYTGPTSAATAAGASSVNVTLTATVTELADGTPGDLTNATATFTDTTTGNTLCTSSVAPGGGASCAYSAPAPRTFAVKVTVGRRFLGTTSADTPLVTTATPSGPVSPPVVVPDTELTSGPPTWLLDTTATYAFRSPSAGASFVCSLDGVAGPCTSPASFAGLAPGTHVFTATAVLNGQADPTPVRVVTTVPVDDRALKAKTKGWKRKSAAGDFLGTFTQTKKKGEVLTYKVKGAKVLALVVGTSPKYGKVKVFVGKKLIKKVNLKGPKSLRRVILLGTFASGISGKVRIETASKKQVHIDGLGVASGV